MLAPLLLMAACALEHSEDDDDDSMKKRALAQRETLIAPLGYQTTPNQYGVFPEGALVQAENVLMRQKGKLITAAAVGSSIAAGSNGYFPLKMMPLDAGHVYVFSSNSGVYQAFETNGTTSGVAGIPSAITTLTFSDTRICPVRSRDRMLVNSNQGVLVSDFMAPTNSTQRALRFAGFPQPNLYVSAQSGGTNFPIPGQTYVGYAAVITREYSDGYIVKSVPSPIIKFYNSNAIGPANNIQITLNVTLVGSNFFSVGDIVEIYRTDGLQTSSPTADPGTTLKLIQRYTLNSTDASNGFIVVVDSTQIVGPFFSTTGKELYTNPYQEGQTGGNRQPDINGAQAVFKGFTFYGNITERQQFTLNAKGGFFNNSSVNSYARANGIGARGGSGTVTSGSNTITGVSAADLVGIVPGQVIYSGIAGFPFRTTVTAVGASTITASGNANANNTTWVIADVLDTTYFGLLDIVSTTELMKGLFGYEATSNLSIGAADGAPSGLSIVIEQKFPGYLPITIRGTNGANYSPAIPEINLTALTPSAVTTPNLLHWSKDSEPEHVPSTNDDRVGSGKIIQLVSTKDALWIFCTDGIFRLSGDAGVWRVDVVAPGCVLCGPGYATSLRDQVYAYTNYGLVQVTDAGVVPLSDLVIKAQLPGPPFSESLSGFIVANDDDEEILLSTGFITQQFYVYNARFNSFTYVNGVYNNITAAAYQPNPASGTQPVLFAQAPAGGGSPPQYAPWGFGNTSWLAPKVQYRAMYAKNPMSLKQWIDMTYMFDSADATKTVTGTLAGVSAGSAALVQSFNDSYATIGVPRKYAIGPSIEPGFTLTTLTTQSLFEGVSVRFVELGIQQVRR